MAGTERITMTMHELDRFKVTQNVADGKLQPWRAAERLGLTTRQIRRLVGRLRVHATGMPASACFNPATICSTLKRLRFIVRLLSY